MNVRATLVGAAMIGGGALAAAVAVDSALAPYQSRAVPFPAEARYVTPTGEIVVVGYNDMKEMLTALGVRFAELHPGFRFDWDLPGTKAAPAALAVGTSAFAPMGAPMTPPQLADYEKITHAPPVVFRVAHASLSAKALSGPLAIFVHRDNPLASLSLAEVAAIFSGADATRGLQPCGVEPDAALGLFFRERVLRGEKFAAGFTGFAQSADVVRRVGEDAHAIGFAAAMRVSPAVKMLTLAERAGEPPIAVSDENLATGLYPLDRFLLICARPPLEPWLQEWLRFVLSRDGQRIVAAGTLGYLPLNAREVREELAQVK